jgi:hypothetical protein
MGEATNKMNTTDWNEERVTSTQHDDSYVASESSDDIGENTEQIRADIEDTRAEMSQTINEIQERLSPEHLMGQVKETVREATIGKVERVMDKVADATEPAREAVGRAGTAIKETGMSVADSMWRNPIPVALIGLGLGMLVMRTSRGNGGDYQMRQTTPRRRQSFSSGQTQYGTQYGTRGTSTGSLNDMKETANDLADRSTAALSDIGMKAKDSLSTAGTWLGQTLRENPLAIGAVAIAAGTAVGLALPSTRIESEYVGETSEKLVDKAQEVARDAIHRVQSAAQQMGAEGEPRP